MMVSGPHLLLTLGSAPHRELAVSTLRRAAGRLTLLDGAQSPFARLSDRVVVLADPRDPRSVALALRRAARVRPDAIIAFNDAYLEAVGEANAALGLRGITAAAARRAYHKHQMRSALRDGGIAVPDFRVVADREHARLAAAGLGYPVCVKPSNRSAGVGVAAVAHPDQLPGAFDAAWRARLGGEGVVLVERLVGGTEVSVESLTIGDQTVPYAVVEKHVSTGARRIETGHTVPWPAGPGMADLLATVRSAVAALGIRDWPTHTEVMLTEHGPQVIEVNPRVAGGLIADLVHSASGFNVYQAMADVLLGRPVEVRVDWRRAAAVGFLFSAPGRLSAVDGLDAARACPGVVEAVLDVRVGDLLPEPLSNIHRRGFVRAVGGDPDSARASCVKAAGQIRLRIDDRWEPALTGFADEIAL